DTFTSLNKQLALLKIVLTFEDVGAALLEKGIEIQKVLDLPIRERIAQAKFLPENRTEDFTKLQADLEKIKTDAEPAGEVL
ncbi:MAG TPA: V-type ATP synthase subunit A, partial [Firmicutes bacterium]|nr:V-type ATP synthase subunit A [Bacillota bacterium]